MVWEGLNNEPLAQTAPWRRNFDAKCIAMYLKFRLKAPFGAHEQHHNLLTRSPIPRAALY